MGWLAWLNPLNWIKVFSLIQTLYTSVIALYKAYQNYLVQKKADANSKANIDKYKQDIKDGKSDAEISKDLENVLNNSDPSNP